MIKEDIKFKIIGLFVSLKKLICLINFSRGKRFLKNVLWLN